MPIRYQAKWIALGPLDRALLLWGATLQRLNKRHSLAVNCPLHTRTPQWNREGQLCLTMQIQACTFSETDSHLTHTCLGLSCVEMPCTLLKPLRLCYIWWPLVVACTIRSNSQDICSLPPGQPSPAFSPSCLCQPSDSWESHSVIQRNLTLPGRNSHRLQHPWPVPSE